MAMDNSDELFLQELEGLLAQNAQTAGDGYVLIGMEEERLEMIRRKLRDVATRCKQLVLPFPSDGGSNGISHQ